ncbi:class I adenylate-forming enzyme family protein [Streptomyces albus]|uniref:Fatty acid--CoA ligase n=1 Tax=Streptomyces albus TaxID=1888 RepID=A0A8H1LJG4_9ACTN|nr:MULTISPECIES: AMP-binding protein [Streptomyces]TGG87112.1 fatty acid--CoA ligase [Streptomyces albus]UVN58548.1 AMP-binding protein [Streptomyces albus]
MNRFLNSIVHGMRRDPRAVALVHGRQRIRHGEALSAVHRSARALGAQGLRRGDIVVLLTTSTPEAVLNRVAAQLIGCCVVTLQPSVGAEVNAAILRALSPAALVHDPALQEAARKVLELVDVPRSFCLGPGDHGTDLTALAAARSDAPLAPAAGESDTALIMHTSGTTGSPKAACHSYATMAEFQRMDRLVRHEGPRRFLHHGSLDSVSGENVVWTLATGGTTVLLDEAGPEEILETAARERVSYLLAYPTMLARLTTACARAGEPLPHLRQIEYTGAPASAGLVRAAVEVFGPRLLGAYGQREAGFLAALSGPEHRREELLGSVGRPLDGVRVELRSPTGGPVAAGGTGAVWVRTPAVMTGYYARPDLTDEVLRDGWLRTGDLGRFDHGGRLFLLGRADDAVIVDGYNVYVREVEEALEEHPGVGQAAAFGVPDPDRGEAVRASVSLVPDSRVAPEELCSWVRDRLGPFHAPAAVRIVAQLPLTARGKIDRRALRAQALAESPDGTGNAASRPG